jgi:hypothetical protein
MSKYGLGYILGDFGGTSSVYFSQEHLVTLAAADVAFFDAIFCQEF